MSDSCRQDDRVELRRGSGGWTGSVGVDRSQLSMRKELFGVFGDRAAFERLREPGAFDAVVGDGPLTVGVRDPALGMSGRSDVSTDDAGVCVVWGEAYAPDGDTASAEWVARAVAERGRAALAELDGSYLVALARDGEAFVATDPIRSWECFYTDAPGVRTFGTDLTPVEETVADPRVRRDALLEFLHLGTVLGEKTLFERTARLPIDAALTADAVEPFRRFVYDPAEFDYEAELARRLREAIRRRSGYPGRTGLLLSGGVDSRTILSELPRVDDCYTIGAADDEEVAVARRLAEQYGTGHTALDPDDRYLSPDARKARYSQGIKESLHVHQSGYTDAIESTTVYHGLLYDTLFKGSFLERDGHTVAGTTLPRRRLSPAPDPAGWLLDRLGFDEEKSRSLARAATDVFDGVALDDPREFLRESIEAELARGDDRAGSIHNATDLVVIRNQPVLPFRTHLADNFVESFVAMDAGLLDWHLRTPPAHRNRKTFRGALERLDDSLLRYRPPDRPHDVPLLNHVEGFLRRRLPFLDPLESAWPDRRALYDRFGVADRLSFPAGDLPPRHALRLNDALCHVGSHADRSAP